jgi:F-type H+-transporting ATPase subunit delta
VTNEGTPAAAAQANSSGETLAAKRYALAAFEIAKQQGSAPAWQTALGEIASFMGDSEVKRVLENTRVDQDSKQRLVEAALADLPVLALNLARLLVRKNRTSLAGDIARVFDQFLEADRGVTHARAVTAVPLSDTEREALGRRLHEQTGHEIVLDAEVDPTLLGGLVIQIGDKLIDASTRSRLHAMRDSLVGAVG